MVLASLTIGLRGDLGESGGSPRGSLLGNENFMIVLHTIRGSTTLFPRWLVVVWVTGMDNLSL